MVSDRMNSFSCCSKIKQHTLPSGLEGLRMDKVIPKHSTNPQVRVSAVILVGLFTSPQIKPP